MFKIDVRYGSDIGYIGDDICITRYEDQIRVSDKGSKIYDIASGDTRYAFRMRYHYELCKYILSSEVKEISRLCIEAIPLLEFNEISSSFLVEMIYFIEDAFMTEHEDVHYNRLRYFAEIIDNEVKGDLLSHVFKEVFTKNLKEYEKRMKSPNVWY